VESTQAAQGHVPRWDIIHGITEDGNVGRKLSGNDQVKISLDSLYCCPEDD